MANTWLANRIRPRSRIKMSFVGLGAAVGRIEAEVAKNGPVGGLFVSINWASVEDNPRISLGSLKAAKFGDWEATGFRWSMQLAAMRLFLFARPQGPKQSDNFGASNSPALSSSGCLLLAAALATCGPTQNRM